MIVRKYSDGTNKRGEMAANRLLSEVRLTYSDDSNNCTGYALTAMWLLYLQTIRTTLELLYCAAAEGRPSARLCWPNDITVSTQKQRSYSSKTSYNKLICGRITQ